MDCFRAFFRQALDCNILRKVKSMERAQRILKKFSKILKEQGAGPLLTTFKGYVTYALYDRWKVRRLRKFPPRMVKNRILFETNDDFTDNCRALFDLSLIHI